MIIIIHNTETGEFIEREMTAEEQAQQVKDKAEAKMQAEAYEKALSNKAALLSKLGLTADELAALLS